MRKYKRVDLKERENIYQLVQSGKNLTFIAKHLNRSKSTISRELSRCRADSLGYLPDRAMEKARSLSRRNLGLFHSEKLRGAVVGLLEKGLTPEQISGRLRLEKTGLRASHETIYKYIYSAEGQLKRLFSYLIRKKPKRTIWGSRKPRKSCIPEFAKIEHRHKSIEKRNTFGHWEGDLVIFRALRSANVTTMVERKSRFVKLVYNPNKYSEVVIGGIRKAFEEMPKKYQKTITFDRGTEFSSFRRLDLDTYFCNPHSPWQKGSNENFNGRLRRYLPKKFNPNDLSQELLDKIADIMNNQPRKCLGYKTPAEVLFNHSTCLVALDP